jgi:hypothetical protein
MDLKKPLNKLVTAAPSKKVHQPTAKFMAPPCSGGTK